MNKIVVLLSVFVLCGAVFGQPLSIQVKSGKSVYRLTDKTVTLHITIQNLSTSTVYLEDTLVEGSGGNMQIIILDGQGHRMNPQLPVDAVLPVGEESSFHMVSLRPDHFWGASVELPFSNYDWKPGQYTIHVIYKSRTDGPNETGIRFWGTGQPALKSNVISVRIVKK